MRIESMLKSMIQFDILDVFQVILPLTLPMLSSAIKDLRTCQASENQTKQELDADNTSATLQATFLGCEGATTLASANIERVSISTSNLFTSFQDLTEDDIRQSNRYYAMYRSAETVKNLAWSADQLLASCEEDLRNKVRKQLVGISALESGRPIVLKLVLDSVMDIDKAAMWSLTQNLQLLQMKNVPGGILVRWSATLRVF